MAVREAGRGVEIKSREVRLETPEQPLHSPKLTQRRAHPAVVYSTPAGERERPRVRRGHVEKTRGRIWPLPRRGLKLRDHVPKSGHILLKAVALRTHLDP